MFVPHGDSEAVKINVSDNDVTIDVYVKFWEDGNPIAGSGAITTANGTSCKDLAVAGIEQWSGYYLDVFGEDIQVTVNVHEMNSCLGEAQKYVNINLNSTDGISNARMSGTSSSGTINMYVRYPGDSAYTDEAYLRTVTHEMGHVFGIDDGYSDDSEKDWFEESMEDLFGIRARRPNASQLNIIDENDIMVYQFNKLNISNTDIGMLIFSYWTDSSQYYADYYNGFSFRKQSRYIKMQGEKE